jgi:hypothetical protein
VLKENSNVPTQNTSPDQSETSTKPLTTNSKSNTQVTPNQKQSLKKDSNATMTPKAKETRKTLPINVNNLVFPNIKLPPIPFNRN